jgi:hypothetical protein
MTEHALLWIVVIIGWIVFLAFMWHVTDKHRKLREDVENERRERDKLEAPHGLADLFEREPSAIVFRRGHGLQ